MPQLQEIREEDASDDVRAAYDDVRTTMGVPFVNLIHRYLATIPDALPFLWARVKPAFADGRIDAAVDGMFRAAALAPLDEHTKRTIAASLDAASATAASRVIDVYNRGNPRNLIVFHALIRYLETARSSVAPVEPPSAEAFGRAEAPVNAMPRLLRLGELSPPLRAAIERLVAAQGLSETGIVPSLWLHLAHWPALIEAASETFVPLYEDGTLRAQVTRVVEAAKAQSGGLVVLEGGVPPALAERRDEILNVVRAFTTGAIPNMVVSGYHLSEACAP